MNRKHLAITAFIVVFLLTFGYVSAHIGNDIECTVIQNSTRTVYNPLGIYCVPPEVYDNGGDAATYRYLNVTGEADFYHGDVYNIRNLFGDRIHIMSNESLDDYFDVFSAGDDMNVSSLRVSGNATTIASIEKCTTGCHKYNISSLRVVPTRVEVETPNMVVTGNITTSMMSGSGTGYACFDGNGKLFRKETACLP